MQSTDTRRLNGNPVATSASEIIALLVRRRCSDVTPKLDLTSCGRSPITGGGFGDVYKGALREGTQVAIKCARLYLQQDDTKGHKVLKHAACELYTWSRLKHENVLELIGLAQYRDQMAMVSPWMDNGSLLQYIERNPEVNRYQLLVGISTGVRYLHKHGTIHGDIKSGNILISRDGVAKLADFGCTELRKNTLHFTTTTSGSPMSIRWAAPEVLLGGVVRSKEADVYALGMTLLETITGEVPFCNYKTDMVVYGKVCLQKQKPEQPKTFPSFNEVQAGMLWEILLETWSYEPASRPNSGTVRESLKEAKRCSSRPLRKVEGPPRIGEGSSRVVSVSSEHYLPPPSRPSHNERMSRPYSYTPAAPAALTLPQPSAMAIQTPESWGDPSGLGGHGNLEDMVTMAFVRALEEARMLEETEIDVDDAESMICNGPSNFGEPDDAESESHSSSEAESTSSDATSEKDEYLSSQLSNPYFRYSSLELPRNNFFREGTYASSASTSALAPGPSSRVRGPSTNNNQPSDGGEPRVPYKGPTNSPVTSPRRLGVVTSKPPSHSPKNFPFIRPNWGAVHEQENGAQPGFRWEDVNVSSSQPSSRNGSIGSERSVGAVVWTSDEDDRL